MLLMKSGIIQKTKKPKPGSVNTKKCKVTSQKLKQSTTKRKVQMNENTRDKKN